MKKDRPFSSITLTQDGPVYWCIWPSRAAWRTAVGRTLTPTQTPEPPTAEGEAERLGIGQRALRQKLGPTLAVTEKASPRLASLLYEARALRRRGEAGDLDEAEWLASREALLAAADAQLPSS